MIATAAVVEAEKPRESLYAPGWADRLTDWIDGLRIPSWAFYLMAWLVLFAVETGVNWSSGVYAVGTIYAYHLVFTGLVLYGIVAVHYLDKVARSCLKTFRPALVGDEADFAGLEYKLTTMPVRSSLLAGGLGVLLGAPISALFADAHTLSLAKIMDSVPSSVLNGVLLLMVYCVQGLYAYHTVRQLNMVHSIYTTSAHVDLFRRGPLYAFSGLSARTAFSWIVIPYVGIASRPGITENVAVLWAAIGLTVLGLVIFAWPLLGMHRLMEVEKKRLLDENGQKLHTAIEETHRRLQSQDLAGMTDLKSALDNLVTEQTVLTKTSTWPWQPGTISVLATALFLPIILWIIERVLERLVGF